MGFSKIDRLRDLLASLPPGVITPTQRYGLTTINSYTDDAKFNGACWIGHERLAREIGVKTRGLMKLLHELGDGTIYEKGRSRPCNRGCKRHLGVIKRHVKKVRVGTRQNYSINWEALEQLSSMYQSTHLQLERMYSGDYEGVLQAQGVSTPVHTYKHNKHNKNLENDLFIKEMRKAIPYGKDVKVKEWELIDQLLSEYFNKGGSKAYALERLGEVEWRKITNPRPFLEKKLLPDLIESWKPTPTPPPFRAEDYGR